MKEKKAPYQKIKDASRMTGLSEYYLRRGCKDGSIRCIKSRNVYYIDIDALMTQLGEISKNGKVA